MTGPMTMNRLIPAAVRRDLQRLATALDDWQDGDRAAAASSSVRSPTSGRS